MLALLRISIGWHFLYLGITKLQDPDFSSAGYLSQSKGPLADYFLSLIPDRNGKERLDIDANLTAMAAYHDRFATEYHLQQEQEAQAAKVLTDHQKQLESYLKEQSEDIQKFQAKWDDFEQSKQLPTANLPYQVKRNADKRKELQSEVKGWLDERDRIWDSLKAGLDQILNDDQRFRGTEADPVAKWLHFTEFNLDWLVVWSNIAIGFCLMVGLFTRFASLAGGLFLLQVVLAQPDWPGIYPPPPPTAGRSLFVTKEFVEMMALFALAATPVGRWGGLDFLVHHLIVRPIFGKREAS